MIKKPLILIIEDDEDDRLLLGHAFESLENNCDIRFFQTGLQLINNAKSLFDIHHLPDLIVLDLNMPGLSGIETLLWLRADEIFKEIPVIFLTTSQSEKEKENCIRSGAAGFYTKPAIFGQLIKLAGFLYEFSLSHEGTFSVGNGCLPS